MPEHDPEKWKPVFRKDYAQTKSQSGMPIKLKLIPLCRGPAWPQHPFS
jgi:hypothetical protein